MLAGTLETLDLSVDPTARRVAAYPEHIADLLDVRQPHPIGANSAVKWRSAGGSDVIR